MDDPLAEWLEDRVMRNGLSVFVFGLLVLSNACGASESEQEKTMSERMAVEDKLLEMQRENDALKKEFISLEHGKMKLLKEIEQLRAELRQCQPPSQIRSNEDAQEASAANQFYEVKEGDTLWGISQQTGVPVETLRSLNDIEGSNLRIGHRLRITTP